MIKKHKIDIILNEVDYSKWEHLPKEKIKVIDKCKKHLKELSNMLSIMVILLLLRLFIEDYKYSEYVVLSISIITLIITCYVIISRIKAKRIIKYILYQKEALKIHSKVFKVRIYVDKIIDRIDILVCIFIGISAISSMVESVDKLIEIVF